MTPDKRYWWKIALELKLRKCSGDAFQDFFSALMTKRYGNDFVRVRAYGSLGDKGCDGYLLSSGKVFQCYGALNGDSGKVKYLVNKMATDFAKAQKELPSIMNEWLMVHNLVEGLPIEAVEKLKQLKSIDKSTQFSFMGLEAFEAILFDLEEVDIEDLLGAVAASEDVSNLQTSELRDLVRDVAVMADSATIQLKTIRPVPVQKLEFNGLPGHWKSLIAGGWQNAHLVSTYIQSHHDPLVGEKVAQNFNSKYLYLRDQNLSPGHIMSSLYESIVGNGLVNIPRQVAAQSLLAYLFESCEIFEDQPIKEML